MCYDFKALLTRYVTVNKVKVTDLGNMARKCGVFPESNKAATIEKLAAELAKPSVHDKPFHLISFDVGLHNFSFCRIKKDPGHWTTPPSVVQWYKVDLHKYTGIKDKTFTPLNYYAIIKNVVDRLIYTEKESPDVVIVERQRFRSFGGARTVVETVLKSNVLEMILIASVLNLGKSELINQSPRNMVQYWAPGGIKKDQRIHLVIGWVEKLLRNETDSVPFRFGPCFDLKNLPKVRKNTLSSAYLYNLVEALNTVNSEYGVTVEKSRSKGDDAADSLLHGLLFFQYEQHKESIRQTLIKG
ncbi:hypothetical protein OGAPHI_005992 [Ogataea philodendri]|uniref:Mitochondrial resolvase Ydc2 catalytic domain-containing protein n=1 Tax=Ogataea philodendri TaxID=1378263 RepID=A0A9P8NZB4_9ASCO|nr:uncharacterized protein OGAPHI_005992 [Ogataea philodendri]KAH3661814.1 hypothetical protein OGAPHI_005992 [Ogataea philodendri]